MRTVERIISVFSKNVDEIKKFNDKDRLDIDVCDWVLILLLRQYAEIERLNAELKAMRSAADSYKLSCERLREENKILEEYPVKTLFGKNNMICSKTSEDYEELIADISNETIKEFVERLKQDVAGIVRCRDCKYMRTIYPIKSKDKDAIEVHVCYLSHWSENSHGVSVGANDFCSYGEKN